MTDAEAVRRVALSLPRTYERHIGGHWKLKVKQLVYVAFATDELSMGFAYPKAERDGLVASAPDTFFLPSGGDLRYQWVCAHLPALGEEEMRELVTDAWRMCVPAMLHELPELPAPAARAWELIDQQDWAELRPLLHPDVHYTDAANEVRGRTRLLAHLAAHPTPKPPRQVEVRDGQLCRWLR